MSAVVRAPHRVSMQSVGPANLDTEDGRERAERSAELGAAIEDVLAEVWRAESWWATEDRIDNAVRYLPPDR